ncbi:MAG: beta-methylarginine biosynthesis bifunctional aminotransferase [Acidobacteriales bacterium]|nr:beta-methylarginine biosynthesis bifunctional aminotransferase [Terriglobales bacterium]
MRARPKHRIVDHGSPFSALQQRIKYAKSLPAEQVSYFVENVPVWPTGMFPSPTAPGSEMLQYSDCNGSQELIDAICRRDNALYDLNLDTENIAVTNGGMHALSLAFRHIMQGSASASAICLAPVFTAVPALMQASGFKVGYYHMQTDTPSARNVLALCRDDTKLVYLNFPHNPLGGIYSDEFMRTLLQGLQQRQIALVLDMVYDAFIFDGYKITSPFSYVDDWSLVYTVNSVSKNYGAPGLRVGWAASSARNVEEMAGMLERECVSVCTPAQTKARSLIEHGNLALRMQVEQSRDIVREFLENELFLSKALPPAGTQVFLSLPVEDIEEFADQMLGEYGLVLATASNYAGTDGAFIRIPTGYPAAETRNAMRLLRHGIERFSNQKTREQHDEECSAC